jgi:YVTN family beta-propeller protein
MLGLALDPLIYKAIVSTQCNAPASLQSSNPSLSSCPDSQVNQAVAALIEMINSPYGQTYLKTLAAQSITLIMTSDILWQGAQKSGQIVPLAREKQQAEERYKQYLNSHHNLNNAEIEATYKLYFSPAQLELNQEIDSVRQYDNYLKARGITINKNWFTNHLSSLRVIIDNLGGITPKNISNFFTLGFSVNYAATNCPQGNFVMPAFPVVALNFAGDTVSLVGFFPNGFQNQKSAEIVQVDVNFQWRNPTEAALSPDGNFAFITDSGQNEVVPVDLNNESASTPIAVGSNPIGIAITPDGKRAYVTDFGSNNVTPIDLSTNTAGEPIAVGSNPIGIAITPDGKRAYVTDFGQGTFVSIDLKNGMVSSPDSVGVGTIGIALGLKPIHIPDNFRVVTNTC